MAVVANMISEIDSDQLDRDIEQDLRDPLYPIAVLIDQLRHDELELRKNAITQLTTIAHALGEERTREELLPFLFSEVLDEEEDEILICLAEQLGKQEFLECVGGQQFVHSLIPPLEELSNKEEMLVRTAATASLCKILQLLAKLNQKDTNTNSVTNSSQTQQSHNQNQITTVTLNQHFIPLVHRLGVHDWFTSRASATALFKPILSIIVQNSLSSNDPNSNVTEDQIEDLLGCYSRLLRDDTPMVRRASANVLADIANVVCNLNGNSNNNFRLEIEDFLLAISKDEHESVRVLTIQNCIRLGRIYRSKAIENIKSNANVLNQTSSNGNSNQILTHTTSVYFHDQMRKIIHSCLADKSWRVRYMIATQIEEISELFGAATATTQSSSSSSSSSTTSVTVTPAVVTSPSVEGFTDMPACPTYGSIYSELLQDSESEVRAVAVSKLANVGKLVKGSFEGIFKSSVTGNSSDQNGNNNSNTNTQQQDLANLTQPNANLTWNLLTFPPPSSSSMDLSASEIQRNSIDSTTVAAAAAAQGANTNSGSTSTSGTSTSVNLESKLRSFLQPLMSKLDTLLKDMYINVRIALGSSLLPLAPVIGDTLTFELITPLCLTLVRDDSTEVRLKLISTLPELAKVLKVEMLSESILPALRELSCDRQWRVRLAILHLAPALAKSLGEREFSQSFWEAQGHNPLGDPVFQIREQATNCTLKDLTHPKILGHEWAVKSVIPHLASDVTSTVQQQGKESESSDQNKTSASTSSSQTTGLISHANYLLRLTAVASLTNLVEIAGEAELGNAGNCSVESDSEDNHNDSENTKFNSSNSPDDKYEDILSNSPLIPLKEKLIKTILSKSNDPVPNVRFNVARSIARVYKYCNNSTQPSDQRFRDEEIMPVLRKLHQDEDRDVKHFCAEAMKVCGVLTN